MQQATNEQKLQSLMNNMQSSGLRQKLIFTFAMIALFRLGALLPIFGIDKDAFLTLVRSNTNIIGFLDLFSGGALGNVSIFALGIGPYITASIIMQLLAVIIPPLEKLQKEEGEAGRRKLQQLMRVFTVVIALFQSLVFVVMLSKIGSAAITGGVSTFMFYLGSISVLTAGAVFVMWLGELITEKGIGNGASLIIFVGILSGIPRYVDDTYSMVSGNSSLQLGLVILLAIFFAATIFIVILHDAIRKVPIVSARRQVGNKVYGGQSSHIPFKLNPGGVMPIIFAIAILLFPSTIFQLLREMKISLGATFDNVLAFLNSLLSPSGISYYVIYFSLIVLLTFFYASIIPNMQPKDIAENLKKYGSAIPGVKPGKPTAQKLDEILTRLMFIGAIALGIIAMVPAVAAGVSKITTLHGIGSTSLIIMVGVALDFINRIKTHLLAKNYETFLK